MNAAPRSRWPVTAYASRRRRMDQRVVAGIQQHQALQCSEPIVEPAMLAVVGRRVAQPVALTVLAPILAGDVVLNDPALLRRRAGQEHLGRHPKAGDTAPLRLVPAAGALRGRAAQARRLPVARAPRAASPE